MKIAVVGATGLVGSVMLKVLEERKIKVTEIIPTASEKSVGKEIVFGNKKIRVVGLQDAVAAKPDIALFSAGASVALEWAPKFAEQGTYVVDNSSAWRMHEKIPLIIPEVNIEVLRKTDHIIANPNCSTIQMLVALAPLHKKIGIRKIIVSTYQSVSGSGIKGISQLLGERGGSDYQTFYPHRIDMNCIPQCDVFTENGYTKEEMKLVNETQKILDEKKLAVSATAVRVPVTAAHSESVYVELYEKVDRERILKILENAKGLKVLDDTSRSVYPTAIDSKDHDEVFVGRIRKDLFNDHAWNLWIVADNLRKGAATNAVQIAEYVIEKFLN